MTAQKNKTLQDAYLNTLRTQDVQVSVYLVNGVMLQGKIEHFDQFVLVLLWNKLHQMIYKHAISTIVPSRALRIQGFGNRARSEEQEQPDGTPEE